jgi:hypothetical protein
MVDSEHQAVTDIDGVGQALMAFGLESTLTPRRTLSHDGLKGRLGQNARDLAN